MDDEQLRVFKRAASLFSGGKSVDACLVEACQEIYGSAWPGKFASCNQLLHYRAKAEGKSPREALDELVGAGRALASKPIQAIVVNEKSQEAPPSEEQLQKLEARTCPSCGHYHPGEFDRCVKCGNVKTKPGRKKLGETVREEKEKLSRKFRDLFDLG